MTHITHNAAILHSVQVLPSHHILISYNEEKNLNQIEGKKLTSKFPHSKIKTFITKLHMELVKE